MVKNILIVMLGVVFCLGCARVRVEGSKEPIKVDISMRLDVYQHVQKDISAIEDIVSGSGGSTQPADKQSLLDYFVSRAYAQEELDPQVEQAALRRKARRDEIASWQEKRVIGEDRAGLLQVRIPEASNPSLEQLVEAENADRMTIYNALAKKNQTSVEAIQGLYAERLQKDAPPGTPVEVVNAASGTYEWLLK
jgi:uncharacterized protein YdbL (DUF1318 family)